MSPGTSPLGGPGRRRVGFQRGRSIVVGADHFPPAFVPIAHQVGGLTVFFTNRTEPSAKQTLTPPGWLLVAVIMALVPPHTLLQHESVAEWQEAAFGVSKWV